MNVIILDDDGLQRSYSHISLIDKNLENSVYCIASKSKEHHATNILKAYLSKARPIIYDAENADLASYLEHLDLSLFETQTFAAMFFTSGSTGFPTGAFKTTENIETDMNALVKIFQKKDISRIIATVPFIHIYGFLAGLMLPLKLDVDLLFKEHFLPHDLLKTITPKSIVVTTPLYIKALLRLDETADLQETIFISSTGPLPVEIAKEFISKFNTNLIQLFGSTECGSIAYKKQAETAWRPFEGVNVSLNENGLLRIQSPFISPILWNKEFMQTDSMIQTFDYANIHEETFELIGRNSHILKVAGKRYSTQQIEELLESMPDVKRALVHIKCDNTALKDEIISIFLETSSVISTKMIQMLLKKHLGKINLPMELHLVEKIPLSAMGKKCLPLQG